MKAPGIRVANDELVTVREVMRDLPTLLERLDQGRIEKTRRHPAPSFAQ